MAVLVTGAAGFIGFHVARRLLEMGQKVYGVDNFSPYYDPNFKRSRASLLTSKPTMSFHEGDILDEEFMVAILSTEPEWKVIHLAAQPGVRRSLSEPMLYERQNVAGHLAVLERCRRAKNVTHVVYASSSSVYGSRPGSDVFAERDRVDQPESLYAATKGACELFSTAYARLFGISITGLRFFTAYGPFGRPDMAYYVFTDKLVRGEVIEIYGGGEAVRDFTFIDDIVDGILSVLGLPPPSGHHRILNIGSGTPVVLSTMLRLLERCTGRTARVAYLPTQAGDVPRTYADLREINRLVGYQPKVDLEEGLRRFVDWYLGCDYHSGVQEKISSPNLPHDRAKVG